MPEIQIRPAVAADIPALVAIDHHGITEYVWQLDFRQQHDPAPGIDPVNLSFHQVRLPRPVPVEYPFDPRNLLAEWSARFGMLVALLGDRPVGYTALQVALAPGAIWVTDLVVDRLWRRQGIGTALLLAALDWATQDWPTRQPTGVGNNSRAAQSLVLVTQAKNFPAIQLALKLGFDFCGYSDQFYAAHEIGVFLAKSIGRSIQ